MTPRAWAAARTMDTSNADRGHTEGASARSPPPWRASAAQAPRWHAPPHAGPDTTASRNESPMHRYPMCHMSQWGPTLVTTLVTCNQQAGVLEGAVTCAQRRTQAGGVARGGRTPRQRILGGAATQLRGTKRPCARTKRGPARAVRVLRRQTVCKWGDRWRAWGRPRAGASATATRLRPAGGAWHRAGAGEPWGPVCLGPAVLRRGGPRGGAPQGVPHPAVRHCGAAPCGAAHSGLHKAISRRGVGCGAEQGRKQGGRPTARGARELTPPLLPPRCAACGAPG